MSYRSELTENSLSSKLGRQATRDEFFRAYSEEIVSLAQTLKSAGFESWLDELQIGTNGEFPVEQTRSSSDSGRVLSCILGRNRFIGANAEERRIRKLAR